MITHTSAKEGLRSTTNTYDTQGKLSASVITFERSGVVVTEAYQDQLLTRRETYRNSKQASGELLKVEQWTYDARTGNVLSRVTRTLASEQGHETRDLWGKRRIIGVIDGLAVDGDQKKVSEERWTYNRHGKRTALIRNGEPAMTWGYNARGHLVRETLVLQRETKTFKRDGRGRIVRTRLSDGTQDSFVYDKHDRLITIKNWYPTYGDGGRPVWTLKLGRQIDLTYNTKGLLLKRSVSYDGEDVTGGVRDEVVYTYDDAGRLLSVKEPGSEAHSAWTYDKAGNLLKQVEGNAYRTTTKTWTYDSAGNMLTHTAENPASQTTFSYGCWP